MLENSVEHIWVQERGSNSMLEKMT